MKPPFLLILLLCLGTSMRADVVISTFEDLNNNGRRDSGEPLITGLTVTAVDNMSRSLPLLDDGAGTHTLPGLVFQGRVRIQITGYDLDHRQGKNRPTTVLFAEDGDSFDIPVLTDQPVDLQTANIIIPCYEKGSAETKDAAPALVHFPFAAEGVSEKFGGDGPNPTQDATISQLGSTWGMAYQRTFRRAFAAALVKRHVGMGPAGEDGIYSIDYSTTPPSINHFNLEGINPAVGPSIELGKVRREIVDVPINETMPYALSTVLLRNRRASYDIDAFDKVGKTSFGDIEMANDGRSLWMVNTYQRSLIKLDVGRKDIDPEAEDLEHYLLEDLPGIPNLNFRFRMCVNAGGNLNQGGAEAFTDKNKVAWDKNRYSNGGNDGYLAFNVSNTLNDTSQTSSREIYQTFKRGNFSYDIPVPADETFEVLLHFAEPENLVEGDRLFDIMSGDQMLVENFDIVKHAGGNKKATVLKLQVSSVDQVLNLRFVSKFAARKNEAILSGYEVIGTGVYESGVLRPWALTFHKGRGYLGVVSDASFSKSREHLFAYLLSFDPENITDGFQEVLAFPLGYPRERASNANLTEPQVLRSSAWQPWIETWDQTMINTDDEPLNITNSLLCSYAQPIFSKINFTDDGSIIIGLMDRWAHQTGHDNYGTELGDRTLIIGYATGDILKAFPENNGTYTLEKTNRDPGRFYRNDDGPSYSGEFFYGDYYSTYLAEHGELATGGQITLPGSDEVAVTVHNPNLVDIPTFDFQGLFSQGLHFYSTKTGERTRFYLFVDQYILGKANGLGDIIVAADAVPQGVGNYVWCDGNGNGIQDPTELGLANVEVRLLDREDALSEVGRTTTDANGEYYFDNLDPAHEYELRIDIADLQARNLSGGVSPIDMTDTLINSDASDTIVPGFAVIRFMTGNQGLNRDDLDFGFLGPVALSDTKAKCEEPGTPGCATFFLDAVAACASNGVNTTVTLHPTFNDADSMLNEITTDIVACIPDDTVYARVSLNSDPNCFSISVIRLVVEDAMTPENIDYLEYVCPSGSFDAETYLLNKDFTSLTFFIDDMGTPFMGDPANIDLSVASFPFTLYYEGSLPGPIDVPDCIVNGSLTLEAINPSIVDAGGDHEVCGLECVDLTDMGAIFNPNGSGAMSASWSTSGTGTFVDDNTFANARLYCPSQADLDNGFVTLTLTVDDDPCVSPGASDDVVITLRSAAPMEIPDAVKDTIDCIHPFVNDPFANDTFPGCRLLVECDDTLVGVPVDYETILGDCENIVKQFKRTLRFEYQGQEYFCMDTITVRALPDTIVCPPMRDTVYCGDDYEVDENGHPSPSETGFPYADTIPLWPIAPGDCDIQVQYKDHVFPGLCPITIKREWTVANTCSGNTETCVQWLMIYDTVPPTILDVDTTLFIPTTTHDCYANVYAPPVEVYDTCTGVKMVKARIEGFGTVVMNYNDTTGLWESHEKIRLPVSEVDLINNGYLGTHTLVYEAFDSCHNKSMDSLEIVVVDKTPPIMVCDKMLNVTVSDTMVWVNAESFNEGSEDNCDIALLLARRLDWATACGVDLCDDISFLCEGEHHDSLWISKLETDKHINPVEAHYAQQLDWITGDPGACNFFLFYGWLYDLIKEATLSCVDHPYPVDANYLNEVIKGLLCDINGETLDSIFPNVDNVDFFLQAVEDIIKLYLKRPKLDIEGILEAIADMGPQIGGGWSTKVPFCCEDACQDVKVELLAMDYWCNWNKCWSTVRVEDKTPPKVISDLYDVSITCASYKTYYEPAVKLALEGNYDSLQSVLGFYDKVAFDQYGGLPEKTTFDLYEISCDSNFVTRDSLHYDEHLGYIWKTYSYYRAAYDTSVTQAYNGQIADDCGLVCIEEMPWINIDHCGTGYIKRVFKFVGQCGMEGSKHKGDTITRTQTIWITSDCEITPAMFEVPKDTVIYSCGIEYAAGGSGQVAGEASPQYTGTGRYTFDNDCRLVGVGYYDKVFKIVGGDEACYKIIRTWCFADWCDIGDVPQKGSWWHSPRYKGKYLSYEQKIILRDTTPPVCLIEGVPEVAQAEGCSYDLQTVVQVIDECGVLYYSWKVVDTESQTVVADGQGDLTSNHQGRFAIEAPELPSGIYSLKVLITDECQNESICDVPFEVKAAKKPAPVCLTSLTVELNPMDLDNDGVADTAMAEVNAIAFDVSSTAACGSSAASLKFLIDDGEGEPDLPPASATKLYLGCQDVGIHQVRMYVSDASGNWDYCDVQLTVQSNMGGCSETIGNGSVTVNTTSKETVNSSKINRNDGTGKVRVSGDAGQVNNLSSFEGEVVLRQNRPNPWKEATIISFDLPQQTHVQLSIYDLTGRVIKVQDGFYPKGYHEWHLDQQDLSTNGVYYYKLQTAGYSEVKRMIKLE